MLFLIKNLIGCALLLFVVNTHLHGRWHKWQEELHWGRVLNGVKTPSCVHPNRNKWPYNINRNCKPKSYLYVQNKKRRKRQAYKLNRYKACSIFSIFDKSNEGKKKRGGRPSDGGVPQEGKQPSAEVPQEGKQPSVEVPQEGKQPSVEVPQEGKQPSVEVPQEGKQPSAEVPQVGKQPSGGVPQVGKPPTGGAPPGEVPPLSTPHGCESEGCIELSNLESNPKEALKNVATYKQHLENFKSRVILSLQTIFCSYTKGIDKKDNLRGFVLHILSDFERKHLEHTHLADVQNMRNEKVREEYLQSNYNCFLDIVKTIEENLYNILLYKIQSVKLKALDDIKETVLSHRESNADYISYVNHVNKTFEAYEKKLQSLLPASFKFSLYERMSRDSGVAEEEQRKRHPSSLSNFAYHFPMEKYEQLIKKNINYVKKLSHDLTKKKKKRLIKEIERSKNYQNILHIIDNQQKQIEILQEQLEANVEGFPGKYSPFHCAVAYRIPDTNLNISTQYVKGKFNVKLNCIPDDSLHLLGSYGFVKALPFGNLGLSFSLNF
ncbi:hypothetical protein, conserved [Plasmodium vivax]|uniref:Peripheral plastid protein 1 n=1 Tax=Plasmodium vivax (strain Salvador I) TaxID=126793 RepID=A5K0M0_PLAVS|nr:hypothetical protein, conserved [Plasmodium vivax]EDL46867.1 hypothetical protein, conserved [Plasmodium vivax]|eukprot:XP_001616594.1 hypothetical protein [Plasmodium vivax Sal-1]